MSTMHSLALRCLRSMGFALVVFLFSGSHAMAQLGSGFATDSEIQLLERSDEGSYQSLSITMTTRDGATTITIIKDDATHEDSMPFEEYAALWQFLLDQKVESIEDAPLENAYPGQSDFTYNFRDGSTTHTFSAYGVDFLESDSRFRDIAREVIRVAEEQMNPPEPPVPEIPG